MTSAAANIRISYAKFGFKINTLFFLVAILCALAILVEAYTAWISTTALSGWNYAHWNWLSVISALAGLAIILSQLLETMLGARALVRQPERSLYNHEIIYIPEYCINTGIAGTFFGFIILFAGLMFGTGDQVSLSTDDFHAILLALSTSLTGVLISTVFRMALNRVHTLYEEPHDPAAGTATPNPTEPPDFGPIVVFMKKLEQATQKMDLDKFAESIGRLSAEASTIANYNLKDTVNGLSNSLKTLEGKTSDFGISIQKMSETAQTTSKAISNAKLESAATALRNMTDKLSQLAQTDNIERLDTAISESADILESFTASDMQQTNTAMSALLESINNITSQAEMASKTAHNGVSQLSREIGILARSFDFSNDTTALRENLKNFNKLEMKEASQALADIAQFPQDLNKALADFTTDMGSSANQFNALLAPMQDIAKSINAAKEFIDTLDSTSSSKMRGAIERFHAVSQRFEEGFRSDTLNSSMQKMAGAIANLSELNSESQRMQRRAMMDIHMAIGELSSTLRNFSILPIPGFIKRLFRRR